MQKDDHNKYVRDNVNKTYKRSTTNYLNYWQKS